MNPHKWIPSPGEIVHTVVQYSDSEQTKSRFPIIVSSKSFNHNHPDVVVAFTTKSSNIKHPRDYDVEISNKHNKFKETGLPLSTTVRCGRLWSVDKRKIIDIIGIVPDDLFNDIIHLVRLCFVEE